jgi:hypothetical protein
MAGAGVEGELTQELGLQVEAGSLAEYINKWEVTSQKY